MEESQRTGRSLSETLRQAAHDAQTPLTSISGFAELLLEDKSVQGNAREHAQIIFDEAARLSGILDRSFAEMREIVKTEI